MRSNTGLARGGTGRPGWATGSRSRVRSAWPPSRRSRNGRFSKVRDLPGGAAVRIAFAQQHCSPDRSDNLSRALRAMEQARDLGAELVIFAELAIHRFFPQHQWLTEAAALAEPISGPITAAIAAQARELRLVTVFNTYESGGGGRCYAWCPRVEPA